MVGSETKYRPYCGGSIVNKHWIVTAAGCLDGGTGPVFIRVGLHARGGGYFTRISKIVKHPKYNSDTYKNDIALVKIQGHFAFNTDLQPIPLRKKGVDKDTVATVSGWGCMD